VNGGEIHGKPQLLARFFVVEDGGRERPLPLHALLNVAHGGGVGFGALQHRARYAAPQLVQTVARVLGKGIVDPLYASLSIGDDHAVVGAMGHQGHELELFFRLHPFGDVRKKHRQALGEGVGLHL